jgi:hypothetical protein
MPWHCLDYRPCLLPYFERFSFVQTSRQIGHSSAWPTWHETHTKVDKIPHKWPRKRWLAMCKSVRLLAFLIMLLCQAYELRGCIIIRIHCIIWDTLRPTFLHPSYLRNLVTLISINISSLLREPAVRVLQGSRDFSLLHSVHTGSEARPASYAMGPPRIFSPW